MNLRDEERNSEAAGCSGSRITVQPERELHANWEVDLAKKLEEYLLKICSGQVTESEDLAHTINFAEAALLLQGSVQVYSRKVEYLYNLVLHALEFLSQKRQQDQSEDTSVPPEEGGTSTRRVVSDEENDLFWGLDDIPVDEKRQLDSSAGKDTSLNNFVKPPANLVVLEGESLDTTGDGTELESYLVATTEQYQDFILLDPSDAVAVIDFLKGDETGKGQSAYRGSTARRAFQSPTRRSGGTALKSVVKNKDDNLEPNKDANLEPSPRVDCSFGVNSPNVGFDPPAHDNFEDNNHGFDMDDNCSEPRDFDDSDDDNDPWKPLNPHEPGNFKVKPFRKVKTFRKNVVSPAEQISITTMFPIAKLHGTISPELTKVWERRHNAFERQKASKSPPLYEKLRQSLAEGGQESFDVFGNPGDFDDDNGYESGNPDIGHPDFDMPETMPMDEDVPHDHYQHDGAAHFETNEAFEHGSQDSHANLEDLCRSHLDALLASIAETEQQTELAARVSTWKHNIEHNLEEQDSRPPFDIHEYGARIIDKVSHERDNGNVVMPFTDVVRGYEKHDIARTFSALLQLVNNGDIGLEKSGAPGDSVCYTAVNPFHVRLLSRDKRRDELQFRLSKKRAKSPTRKGSPRGDRDNKSRRQKSPVTNPPSSENGPSVISPPPQQSCKFSVKLGKIGRCTPESKRRRRSRIVDTVNLRSSGL